MNDERSRRNPISVISYSALAPKNLLRMHAPFSKETYHSSIYRRKENFPSCVNFDVLTMDHCYTNVSPFCISFPLTLNLAKWAIPRQISNAFCNFQTNERPGLAGLGKMLTYSCLGLDWSWFFWRYFSRLPSPQYSTTTNSGPVKQLYFY